MSSRKQKAIYLAAGGTAAAAFVWLRYAKSASGARSFLSDTSEKASRTLDNIQSTLSTMRNRIEEVDRFVHELVQVGSRQKLMAEAVIKESLMKLEQTADVVQKNLTESSNEIATMLKDIRTGVGEAVSPKPHRAA